jgi:hypothetical protein
MVYPHIERRKLATQPVARSLQTRVTDHLLGDNSPKFIGVLLLDSDPLRWALSWLGFAFAVGLALADTSADSYIALLSVAPKAAWATAYALYGLSNLYSCLVRSRSYIRLTSGSLGLCLWGFTFLSFVRVDGPTTAIGLLLVVLAASEVWLYAEVMVKISRQRESKCQKA